MVEENYEEAVKHFSNGLSLIDHDYKLLNRLLGKVPLKVYKQIKIQIQDIHAMLPCMKILYL